MPGRHRELPSCRSDDQRPRGVQVIEQPHLSVAAFHNLNLTVVLLSRAIARSCTITTSISIHSQGGIDERHPRHGSQCALEKHVALLWEGVCSGVRLVPVQHCDWCIQVTRSLKGATSQGSICRMLRSAATGSGARGHSAPVGWEAPQASGAAAEDS